ncbi:unnamed protein product [Darwinula stevensoni]|uniref:Uncharacterized protein n=1 Tax=Darwinula stevensoni TaxID=69355 RepID=A0A7R8XLL6_9CRUS|nr:unnamed protein product [Darwinula stevensoni]CAG0894392.1 unnamed protein product [Darwinula stevensoni]
MEVARWGWAALFGLMGILVAGGDATERLEGFVSAVLSLHGLDCATFIDGLQEQVLGWDKAHRLLAPLSKKYVVNCVTGREAVHLAAIGEPRKCLYVLFYNEHQDLRPSGIEAPSFRSNDVWLVLHDSLESEEKLISQLGELPIFLDSNLYAARQDQLEGDAEASLHEAIGASRVTAPLSFQVGTWDGQKLTFLMEKNKYERRKDLAGVHFKVCSIESDPFVLYIDNEKQTMTGVFGETWMLLQQVLNFTFEDRRLMEANPALNIGSLDAEGEEYDGLFGMLQRAEIDVVVSELTITKTRSQYMDFPTPIHDYEPRMYTAKKQEKNAWMSYWRPFSLGLWLASLAGIVVLALTLWFVQANEGEDGNLQSWTFSTDLLVVWSASCMQGIPREPKHPAARFTVWLSFMLGLLLVNSYSAVVTSFLAVDVDALPFSHWEEIRFFGSSWKLGIMKESSDFDLFYHAYVSNEAPMAEIYEKLILGKEKDLYGTLEDAVRRTDENPNYAFVGPSESVSVSAGKCKLSTIPGVVASERLTFALTRNSLYTNIFSHLKNWRQLRERFNLKSDDLLEALDETDGKVFRFGEVETIKAISEPEKRFDEIFDILFAKNPNVYYDVLLNALKALDRQDILDFLESADDAPQSQTSPTGREEQQHPIGSSSDREDGVQLLAEPQSSSASVESATVSDETDARGYSIRKVISKLGGKKQDEDSSDPSRDHLWKPKIPDKLDCYKMKGSGGKDRGWAIIFCYEEFDQYLQLPPRKGVQKDVNNLTRVFKDRGFSVKTYKNLKYQSIKEELYEISQSPELEEHECLIVCFLSHGEEGGLLYAKNNTFMEEELWRPFYGDECKALVDKPKLFFIQACRGERIDDGVKKKLNSDCLSGDEHDGPAQNKEYHLPTHANILIAHATYEVSQSPELEEHECLIVCFLSHGEEGGLLYAKNKTFMEEELWRPFYGDECKALVDKPKLFFIQACRGERIDDGVKKKLNSDCLSGDEHDGPAQNKEYHLPTHANILIAHATYEGHVAFRNRHVGSYFIYTLCKVFEKHSETLDVLRMLTMVAGIMADDFKTRSSEISWKEKKQMPIIQSTLTKIAYLKPKSKS